MVCPIGHLGILVELTELADMHFFIDALNNSVTSVRMVRICTCAWQGPCRLHEKSCGIVFTLQEGLWTAQCLDIWAERAGKSSLHCSGSTGAISVFVA